MADEQVDAVVGHEPEEESGRSADRSDQAVALAFGRSLKTLRTRIGMDRETLGKRLGYSASTIASFEQGRRIPPPKAVDQADGVVDAGGLLKEWKEPLEKAQYPAFFRGMAQLEKEAMELLAYDTLVVNGLLQTEEYTRALLAMRRPLLDEETVEQRVTARLARQDIFDRRPTPFLSFVMNEAVLRHRYGGKDVLRGQLEHLLLVGQRRNAEIQIMPTECEENPGMDGPFMVLTRKDGRKFMYVEVQGISSLVTDPERTVVAGARYGMIRSQALSPRESLQFIEKLLGEL
ncbi:helix-turn-helix domain-containing protein [Streptomyces sp. NPDC056144]|uniref:helix-turn-helix domain-containing protein n=1 Tax=unclassified Streptomyces TaxID=2593676 RepID=UPI0035E085AA